MTYSNGYDLDAVMAALQTRVAFRQPASGSPELTSDVSVSDSGRYFQDFHALVTVDNIKKTLPEDPATDEALSDALGEMRDAAIMRMLNGVFPGIQVYSTGALFERIGYNDQLTGNTGKFVGWEIRVASDNQTAVQINSISLFLDSAKTFNVYLFKDGKAAPVKTKSVTTVAGDITRFTLDQWVINRGKYWIGYFQDDIDTAKAYAEQVSSFGRTLKFSARPIETTSTGATTFNRENISYPSQPLMNAEISSFKDLTQDIVAMAPMFDEGIGLCVACKAMEQMAYATRSNSKERITKEEIDRFSLLLDLNGVAPISESPRILGFKDMTLREIATIQKSFDYKPKVTIATC